MLQEMMAQTRGQSIAERIDAYKRRAEAAEAKLAAIKGYCESVFTTGHHTVAGSSHTAAKVVLEMLK